MAIAISTKAQEGIKKILLKLSEQDLFSLTFTVTKGFIKTENIAESLQVILLYSESPELLLKRRKLKKEVLLNYLKDEGIVVSVNADKNELTRHCLRHWQTGENQPCYPDPEPMESEETENSASEDDDDTITPELTRMGQMFSSWFYELLNQISQKGFNEMFGPNHFWPDCSIKFFYLGKGPSQCGKIDNAETVVDFLTKLMCTNAFQLDVSNVSANKDAFGLIKIIAQGVVHQRKNSVGLFKQLFGLIRDPTHTDHWKIKFSEMQLQVNCIIMCPFADS